MNIFERIKYALFRRTVSAKRFLKLLNDVPDFDITVRIASVEPDGKVYTHCCLELVTPNGSVFGPLRALPTPLVAFKSVYDQPNDTNVPSVH